MLSILERKFGGSKISFSNRSAQPQLTENSSMPALSTSLRSLLYPHCWKGPSQYSVPQSSGCHIPEAPPTPNTPHPLGSMSTQHTEQGGKVQRTALDLTAPIGNPEGLAFALNIFKGFAFNFPGWKHRNIFSGMKWVLFKSIYVFLYTYIFI